MAQDIRSLEEELESHLPPSSLSEVKRILYGKSLAYVVYYIALYIHIRTDLCFPKE